MNFLLHNSLIFLGFFYTSYLNATHIITAESNALLLQGGAEHDPELDPLDPEAVPDTVLEDEPVLEVPVETFVRPAVQALQSNSYPLSRGLFSGMILISFYE